MDDKPSLEDKFMELLGEIFPKHEGEWTVLAEGEESFFGFYKTDEEAYAAHIRKYGPNRNCLIREISRDYLIYGKYGKPETILSLLPV